MSTVDAANKYSIESNSKWFQESLESEESSDSEEEDYTEELLNEIEYSIKNFLFPYISNQITSETEERTINTLDFVLDCLCKKHSIAEDNENFRSLVLSYYIAEAAKGLYTNHHLDASFIRRQGPGEKVEPTEPKDILIHHSELTEKEKEILETDDQYQELLIWYRDLG